MYQSFYGLSDVPFTIAPDPHYLFLSDRHREALTYLTYGLGTTGGFVLLTGEVGTGKTTVSRYLLSQLSDKTDTAFILNPTLTEIELLETICDEFGIKIPKKPSLKQLTDCISQFLLESHKQGRQTILLVDEAQHLRAEVLEQLRLLTNLETDTKKLLQVVLIGQPELQELLRRKELRQLAQRITARYHLLPLNAEEVANYVRHRLHVAGRDEPVFSKKAIKALYRRSGGIARIINLIAERALMAGYAKHVLTIDADIINLAASEVLGETKNQRSQAWLPWVMAGSVSSIVIGAMFLWNIWSSSNQQGFQAASYLKQVSYQPVDTVQSPKKSQLLPLIYQSKNVDLAFRAVLDSWNLDLYQGLTVCQSVKRQQHACYQHSGTLLTLKRLNYPAVVSMQDQGQIFYAALLSIQDKQLQLQLADQQVWVSSEWFNERFTGAFELIWKPEHQLPKKVGPGSQGRSVQWLENALAKVQNQPHRFVRYYDEVLSQKIQNFQRQYGLRADGIAGYKTLIQISLLLHPSGPKLIQEAP